MNIINEMIKEIVKFRDERDWKQFHTPKDMVISLSLEASELLEIFQWKSNNELSQIEIANIGEELSDILYYTLLISHDLDIDIEKEFFEKMKMNEKKYPVDKAKGVATKYDKL
jgi:NTP pyrophosphatase (non-canonical NTP hydrolase)